MGRERTRTWVRVVIGAVAGGVAAGAWAQGSTPAPQEEHVRGDVASRAGDTFAVKSRSGEVITLKLADDARVTRVEKADLASIGKGSFVGTTALEQPDGSLRAVEVHVFPESMRGTGEGHRPWDLGGSSSTMTNGTVSSIGGRSRQGGTMTNATVAEVRKGGTGETLALRYQGGRKTVLVPPGTPVVKVEPGDRAQLVEGAHVFVGVVRERDGALVARRVVVGKDVVPPM